MPGSYLVRLSAKRTITKFFGAIEAQLVVAENKVFKYRGAKALFGRCVWRGLESDEVALKKEKSKKSKVSLARRRLSAYKHRPFALSLTSVSALAASVSSRN